MDKFYKLAQPNGWDFYTGNTINYGDNIGKIVRRKNYGNIKLCSNNCLHASRNPNQAFIGASIPCSVYLVQGKPINEDSNKAGFRQLKVLEKLNPEKVFKWRYKEACNPIHPFKIAPPMITKVEIDLLKNWASVWTSVAGSVRDSVEASLGRSVRISVRASIRDSLWNSMWDSVEDPRDSVWDLVEASLGGLPGTSMWGSVWAYTGWIFSPCIKEWKYIRHKPGKYAYQSAIDLWMQGLISNYNGRIWQLHGGKDAKILWEGKL